MAHIPYGYSIERGRAVVVPEEAERLKTFFETYLSGCSIRIAGGSAGIAYSHAGLRRLLTSSVYLGTEYYPAILERETYDAVQEALERRTHAGHTKPLPIAPVETKFVVAFPDENAAKELKEKGIVAYLYSRIAPCATGRKKMNHEEWTRLEAWRKMIQEEE